MNNGKKYLIIASGVLILLMLFVFILQGLLRKGGAPSTQVGPSPTLNPYQYVNRQRQSSSGSSSSISWEEQMKAQVKEKAESQVGELKKMLPLETDDYIVEYSPNLDKLVLTRKTENADQSFNDWLIEHNYPYIVNNPDAIIYSDKTMEEVQTPYVTTPPRQRLDTAISLFSIILNQAPPPMLKLSPTSTPSPTPTPKPEQSSSKSSSSASTKAGGGKYVYYSQCHGPYDNYPLAAGCTVCRAGCGPTTVAMILSSYVDTKYTPPYVVDIYKANGAAACGTSLWYAKSLLSSSGVKTSDYIIPYTGEKRDVKDVADDLREYIDNGWTIFVLATYQLKDGSWGGHYFWMTDISDPNNIMAYDPYYGMDKTPPINETAYYPNPKYLAAFGVKKI